jgi:transmembrane sensor
MKTEYWDIIAKQLADEELSKEEKEIFESMKSDSEMKKIIDESNEVIDKTDIYFNLKKFDTDKAWDILDNKLNHRSKFSFTWVLRAAAVILMLITTSLAIWQFGSKKHDFHEFATTQFDMSMPEMILPDGTKVILNHSSKIEFPDEFSGKTREITLSGEAFFEVTPNPEKPFIIKTNGASVKVLGTSFNVYAYNNVPTVEVIVKTGKVELREILLTDSSKSDNVLLLPGEKGVFNKNNGKISKENNFNSNNLSWITHEIKFNYTQLDDVINTLRRTYNLQIEVDSNVDKGLQLSATFTQQKPEYIMDIVALTLNLKLEKTGNNSFRIKNNN